MNVHCIDDDDRGERWLIIVDFRLGQLPTFEARIPKACTRLHLQAFLAAVMRTMREKWRGPQ